MGPPVRPVLVAIRFHHIKKTRPVETAQDGRTEKTDPDIQVAASPHKRFETAQARYRGFLLLPANLSPRKLGARSSLYMSSPSRAMVPSTHS
jgi:hypothetical protein